MVVHEPPDYYAILGVRSTASGDEIRAAYRRLAMRHHPDVNPPDEDDALANELMCRINRAYEVLNDPLRRAQYDRQLRARTAYRPGSIWDRPCTRAARWQRTSAPRTSSAPFAPDWIERFLAAEARLKAQLGPLVTLISALAPVLILCGLLAFGVWAYAGIQADPNARTLFSYAMDVFGGPEQIYTLAAVVLVLFIAGFVWWRSFSR